MGTTRNEDGEAGGEIRKSGKHILGPLWKLKPETVQSRNDKGKKKEKEK
jgi:hypothetical protein